MTARRVFGAEALGILQLPTDLTDDQAAELATKFTDSRVQPAVYFGNNELSIVLYPRYRTIPLGYLLAAYRPGSGDWSWDDEEADLRSRRCAMHDRPGCYQEALERYVGDGGGDLGPVLLGDDGRVHDGHHRIIAYRRLGRGRIPYRTYADMREDDHV